MLHRKHLQLMFLEVSLERLEIFHIYLEKTENNSGLPNSPKIFLWYRWLSDILGRG